MRYPSVREQDQFLSNLGIDPFRDNVEIVTVHSHDDRALTVFYHVERGNESFIALHWPGEESVKP
jgi:hypothetical protein